jgi:phospholipid/cholesterol/gamma-HCH transport system substrate-binding protein
MNNRKSVYIFIVAGSIIFGLLIMFSAMRQGWFSPTQTYYITFNNGDGVFVGTAVSISGLKAGSVTQVELNQDNKVVVKVRVQSKFAQHIRGDSKATLGRPFIIGERAIAITPGSQTSPRLAQDSTIPGEESLELTDLLSGGRLSPYFKTFTSLLDQLRVVIEGDGGPNAVNLVTLYKQAYLSLKAVELAGHDLGAMKREVFVTPETKKIIKEMANSSDRFEALLSQTNQALPAITKLTAQVVDIMPQLSKTLQETTFTMQAMQRSFILSGGVKKLKKEQAEAQERAPASESESAPAPAP